MKHGEKKLLFIMFLMGVLTLFLFTYFFQEKESTVFTTTEFPIPDEEYIDKKTPKKIEFKSKLKIESSKEIVLSLSKDDLVFEDNRESKFSKTYALVSKFSVKENKKFKIQFAEPITNVHSVIIVGSVGNSKIANFKVLSDDQNYEASELNTDYFENDTKRFELGSDITKIKFEAESTEEDQSSFSIYFQILD